MVQGKKNTATIAGFAKTRRWTEIDSKGKKGPYGGRRTVGMVEWEYPTTDVIIFLWIENRTCVSNFGANSL